MFPFLMPSAWDPVALAVDVPHDARLGGQLASPDERVGVSLSNGRLERAWGISAGRERLLGETAECRIVLGAHDEDRRVRHRTTFATS
jgi:hypothetical protein